MAIVTLPLSSTIMASHRVVERVLCAKALCEIQNAPAQLGTVLRKGVDAVDEELRLCHQALIIGSPVTREIEAAMRLAAEEVTAGASTGWQLDGPLYNRYPVGGMFRTHTDASDDWRDSPHVRNRRLTIVCFLNDCSPDNGLPTCDGGALVVYERRGGAYQAQTFLPQAGTIVMFDAGLMHEVRPVIRGERFSAVAWLYSIEEEQHAHP